MNQDNRILRRQLLVASPEEEQQQQDEEGFYDSQAATSETPQEESSQEEETARILLQDPETASRIQETTTRIQEDDDEMEVFFDTQSTASPLMVSFADPPERYPTESQQQKEPVEEEHVLSSSQDESNPLLLPKQQPQQQKKGQRLADPLQSSTSSSSSSSSSSESSSAFSPQQELQSRIKTGFVPVGPFSTSSSSSSSSTTTTAFVTPVPPSTTTSTTATTTLSTLSSMSTMSASTSGWTVAWHRWCCSCGGRRSSSSSSQWSTLTELSLPSIWINLTLMIPHFWTASYIGRHFGPTHLVGYALASVTANIFQGTLLQGLFNASDTLSPQAFGAGNFREVGLLAVRGYVVATVVVVLPVNVLLYWCMPRILQAMGQDEDATYYAYRYFCVYSLTFPFYTLFYIQWKFLAAQSILWPLTVATLVSTLVVYPLALPLLGHALGFVGPAVATLVFYLVECVVVAALLGWYKPHVPETWPGWRQCWHQALWPPQALWAYVSLGLGGILAFLEWVYWEALYLMVGTFGVLPLSAHTIPAAVLDVLFMIPFGIAMALSIRMGNLISHDVSQTKTLALATLTICMAAFGVVSVLLYVLQDLIVSIFTQDADVQDWCALIWPNVAVCYFVLSIYAMVIGMSIGLGLQWTLGVVTVISLWGVGMPSAYYFAVVQEGGLLAVWTWMWPPYLMISVVMCTAIFGGRVDWQEISLQVQKREGMEQVQDTGEPQQEQEEEEDHALLQVEDHAPRNQPDHKDQSNPGHEQPPKQRTIGKSHGEKDTGRTVSTASSSSSGSWLSSSSPWMTAPQSDNINNNNKLVKDQQGSKLLDHHHQDIKEKKMDRNTTGSTRLHVPTVGDDEASSSSLSSPATGDPMMECASDGPWIGHYTV